MTSRLWGHVIFLSTAFLDSPAKREEAETETEIPVVQSLHLEDDEEEAEKNEEKSGEEKQLDKEDDGEAPSAAAAAAAASSDQSERTDASGTTEAEPEPIKNLIELETAEEKGGKTLEVAGNNQVNGASLYHSTFTAQTQRFLFLRRFCCWIFQLRPCTLRKSCSSI